MSVWPTHRWHLQQLAQEAFQFEVAIPRMSAASSLATRRHCKICGDPDHRSRECPIIDSEEDQPEHVRQALSMDAESEASRFRKGQRERDALMLEPQRAQTPKRAPRARAKVGSPSEAWETISTPPAEIPAHHRLDTPPPVVDLTEKEMQMIAKSRARRNATKLKKEEGLALTGIKADYPSLSHAYSLEVPFNMVECLRSRMMVFMWKKMFWELRVKQAVEGSVPGARWKKNRRWLAGLLAKEVGSLYGHYGAMRQRLTSPVGIDLM
eukprot:s914_g15.t1